MTSEPLPTELGNLTPTSKDMILGLRGLQQLGLVHSDDQPIVSALWRRVIPLMETLTQLNWTARRALGSAPAPAEKRHF